MEEKIEKVQAVSRDEVKTEEREKPSQRTAPNKEQFDNAMEEAKTPATATQDPSRTSLMDTVRNMNYANTHPSQATQANLIAQTQEAITQIEKIKKALESPNVSVKKSAQSLLNSKLEHIDESLKVALSKTGIEYVPVAEAGKTPNRVNPIERFLSFLTDGQWQLEKLGDELKTMSDSKEITPVNMLAIQVKVGMIQQELELFSTLLSKGLDSVKTIMNIQV